MPKGLWDVHYARLWQCGNPILTGSVSGWMSISSDFHNSNFFSEHLGTHYTLEL